MDILSFLSVVALVFCYAVAAGLAIRIYLYKKTGDSKYKHDYFCWRKSYAGKHAKKPK